VLALSEEINIQIIKQLYEAWKKREIQIILNQLTEDTEWSVAGPVDEIPWAGPFKGRNGVAKYLRILNEFLKTEEYKIHEYFARSDKVVVLGYQRGKAISSGKPYEIDFVHVWTLRDGKIEKYRGYYDTAQLAAVIRCG
jgi:ketosteroid isomerase-like protein